MDTVSVVCRSGEHRSDLKTRLHRMQDDLNSALMS